MVASGLAAFLAVVLYSTGLSFTGVSAYSLFEPWTTFSQHVLGPSGKVVLNKNTGMEWDIRYHLGGNSPWISKTKSVVPDGIDPPKGCRVDQVHMMARHAERYPTVSAGIGMLELYHHVRDANVTMNDTLAFVNEWDFFMKDPSDRLENLVATGPYAGTLEAFDTGVKLRTRYEHLLDYAIEHNETSLWASGSKRVVETAQYFAAGLYGLDWQDFARLHIIPETEDRGGDTLTAGKTCFRYLHNADEFGRQYGYRMWNDWREVYLPPITKRLGEQNPGIAFSTSEVYSMQELCGFETIAKGSSKWCDVFTHEEWLHFEYARDILHYYRTGPGNPYSKVIGWLWLNATASLLQQGPGAGTLFFSFVHDGDIIPMLTVLDLLSHEKQHLPTTSAPRDRAWRTSDVVPMGGRIVFERLVRGEPKQCWDHAAYGYPNHVYCSQSTEEHFIRINVNDGIMALPGCDSGPGNSCPLEEFLERVKRKGEEVGDFREVCGLPRSAKGSIGFLYQ